MRIENWWPLLNSSTQQWLINNNGDVLPPDILAEITAVAGQPSVDATWTGVKTPDGYVLTDQAVDWIEATANDEAPEAD